MFTPPGTLNLGNAKIVLEEGLHAIVQGQSEFDLAQVKQIDSSAVAIMLLWQSRALKQGHSLVFSHCPMKLVSLVDAYGVADVLQVLPDTVV